MHPDYLGTAVISVRYGEGLPSETEELLILTTLFWGQGLCELLIAVLPTGFGFFNFPMHLYKAQTISSDPSADTTNFLVVFVATFLFFVTEHVTIISVAF